MPRSIRHPRRAGAGWGRVLPLPLAVAAGYAHAQILTRTWTQPASGNWGVPANRVAGQVPDFAHEAALVPGATGACVVFLDADRTLDAVTVESPQAVLYLGGYGLWLVGARASARGH